MNNQIADDCAGILGRIGPLPEGTYLITGATGVIGSYLTKALSMGEEREMGPVRIHAVSHRPSLDPWIEDNSAVTRHFGDVSDPDFVASLPKCDVVIQAAGYGQPGKFLANPLDTLKLNVIGTMNLINHVENGGQFLYLSSSEVYSGLDATQYTEEDIGTTTPYHPRAGYIEAKRSGEAVVAAFSRMTGIPAASARVALAYGPGTRRDDSRVLNELVARALQSGYVSLKDSGAARRTYCYVSDAALMLLAIIQSKHSGPVNVGGTSRTTIRDLAKLVADLAGAEFKEPDEIPTYATGAPDDVSMDLSRVLSFGVVPDWVDLETGLARTISWQRDNLGPW